MTFTLERFDLDAFVRFWAVESLVWHRDGYSGNANNFFIYADPSDGGRFHIFPWGADGTFTQDNRPTVPDSPITVGFHVERCPLICAWLYQGPDASVCWRFSTL